MANHDFLIPYSEDIEGWLGSEGCRVPSARAGNRYPTKQEVIAAVEAEGLRAAVDDDRIMVLPPPDAPAVVQAMTRSMTFDVDDRKIIGSTERSPLSYLVEIHSYHWEECDVSDKASITMRGNFPMELFLVRNLAEQCGQLVLYPDTGDTPVVVEPGCNIIRVADKWLEVVKTNGTWANFYGE